jgi:hypothetical protein
MLKQQTAFRYLHADVPFFKKTAEAAGYSVIVQLSAVSAFETNLRFAGREDFWIIVAARSEDETEIRAGEAAGGRHHQRHSTRDASTFFS